ncbi:maleylpyruvate isomerase family mycothiol-dependent enzyme [Actinokineospora iranica]|uniref:TIGR03083 family protein n=1 Tax=Actinokineospora iranica TaxID=1271860 RepID=A0A1G6TMR9_9PSEU|nr:maleylpyruvate isomerase family mycothiol-dependent enzyme [Actinokineospora iranica]SDD29635.1 TIGR03083 family protein [Actinokineospora iranica]
MNRDQVWREIAAARLRLADLLDDLPAEDWERPSLCAGWRVREVAAHLTLSPQTTLRTVLVEMARARGDFDKVVDVTARRQAKLPTAEIVAQIRAFADSRRFAPGSGPVTTLMDVLTHTHDIMVPLNRTVPIPTDAARAALAKAWSLAFVFGGRKRFRDLRLTATDSTWAVGTGKEVSGPTTALLLLVTGRQAALDRLSGDGVAVLKSRL